MRALTSLFASSLLAPGMARAADAVPPARKTLAVCADPANLPYSNEQGGGFENRIAALLAADLHEEVRNVWNVQRRGFLRRGLLAGACDVVISVPAGMPMLATTRPYFASSYVAVTRAQAGLHFGSFDDGWLRQARIGLQLLGAEGANTPPAMALGRRSVTGHITGYAMWADESVPEPQGKIIAAVAHGDIDVAFVWGPFAGYFARPFGAALRLDPVLADPAVPKLAFVYPMALGVRKTDTALRDSLQAALDRHAPDIAAILRDYHIPTQSLAPTAAVAVVH